MRDLIGIGNQQRDRPTGRSLSVFRPASTGDMTWTTHAYDPEISVKVTKEFRNSSPRLSQVLQRLEGEFLATDGKLVHQTALGVHEDNHPLRIFGLSMGSTLRTGTDAGADTCGSGPGPCPHRYGDRLGSGAELEIPAGEFIVCPFVLEKDDLTEGLSSRLKSDRSLDHR